MSSRSTALLVGNIPYETSEEQMKDVFAQIGPVLNFKLFCDKESGKPKGYGICEYRDPEMALSAIRNLNGYEIKGRALRVDVTTSERSKEELKNLQILGGPSGEDTRDSGVESEKAPEAISKAVASLPPDQMFELMKQMKMCIQNNPNEARNLLLQNPQLAYALLQAQVVMRIVDPQVAINILNRPNPGPITTSSSPATSEAEPVKTTATTSTSVKALATTSSGSSVSVNSSQMDTSPSNVPISSLPSTTAAAAAALPSATTSLTEGTRNSMAPSRSAHASETHVSVPEVSRQSIPPSRHRTQREAFGPFGDPRSLADRDMRIPSRGDLNDVRLSSRVDQDMRQPQPISLGDQDMRQPMGDHDFRIMRIPQMMDSRPFDPRLRAVPGGDTLGRPVASSASFERGAHPFDPRTAHETRPSGTPARLEDPRTAMRSQTISRTGPATSTTTAALTQSLSGIGNSRPPRSVVEAANAIAPHDQEKAALIMQVLQLSDEQIAMLPPGQRQSILILKEQIARARPT